VKAHNWKLDAGPRDFRPREIPLDALEMPADGVVHAWYLDLGKLARSLRGALDGHVGADDPAPFTAGQLRFARRFYLRLLLGAYLGLPGKSVKINRHVRGKPVLDASVHSQPLHFSMAKSEGRLLIGFARSVQLGVDLEPMSRRALKPLGVARRYFSSRESAALAALPPAELDAAFLRAWACKEAVVKASGEGIANQLCRFTVEIGLSRPPGVLEIGGDRPDAWSLALVRPEAAFLGAVAARSPRLSIRAFRLLPAALEP
jgi:4'-phosphopantetheinyl transferase